MFLRNRQALFFTLFMPLFIMLIFGYIGFDKPQKIDVGLVIEQPNEQTTQFVEVVRQFPTFNVFEGTLEAERAELDEGNRAAVIAVQNDLLVPGADKVGGMVLGAIPIYAQVGCYLSISGTGGSCVVYYRT